MPWWDGMANKHEGTIDQWQRGSVTPPEHNLRRNKGVTSRREQRLQEPPPPTPKGPKAKETDPGA